MNYKKTNLKERISESSIWNDLSKQDGQVLPDVLEKYLLLENYSKNKEAQLDYLHILMSESLTVLLCQEERIRKLEESTYCALDLYGKNAIDICSHIESSKNDNK